VCHKTKDLFLPPRPHPASPAPTPLKMYLTSPNPLCRKMPPVFFRLRNKRIPAYAASMKVYKIVTLVSDTMWCQSTWGTKIV